MNISELILVLFQTIVVYLLLNIGFILIRQAYYNQLLHRYMLAIASGLFSLVITINILKLIPVSLNATITDIAHDWIRLCAQLFLLTGLGLLIRHSKPKVTQAPIILSFLPFLLILAYPLIVDTLMIKKFIFILLYSGSAIISILMFSVLTYSERNYQIILLSALFFATAIVMGLVLQSVMALSYSSLLIALLLYRRGYMKHKFNH